MRTQPQQRSTPTLLLLVALAACEGGGASDPESGRSAGDPLHDDTCQQLLHAYAQELPNTKLCEPGTRPCTVGRPIVVGQVEPNGERHLTGLGTSVLTVVNASRTAVLDDLLQRYTAAGCEMGPTPTPNPPVVPDERCVVEDDGVGRCSGVIRGPGNG